MRQEFQFYLPIDQAKIQNLWTDCLFVLDTNTLLDLYRISEHTRMQYVQLLQILSKRIWIPHQVALEFMKNRYSVISNQMTLFSDALKLINALRTEIDSKINALLNFRIHPSLDKTHIKESLMERLNELQSHVESLSARHPNYLYNDPIVEKVMSLFEGKVGEPYTQQKIEQIEKDAKERYAKETPPGFKDKSIGDLMLWLQTIDKAKKENVKSIILVTSDVKDDWWLRLHGKTIGPRPELREEMMRCASADFHMYTLAQFLEHAKEYVMKELSNSTIKEVEDLTSSLQKSNDISYAARKIGPLYLKKIKMKYGQAAFEQLRSRLRELELIVQNTQAEVAANQDAFEKAKTDDDKKLKKLLLHESQSRLKMYSTDLIEFVKSLDTRDLFGSKTTDLG